jgi:hypothetical protein
LRAYCWYRPGFAPSFAPHDGVKWIFRHAEHPADFSDRRERLLIQAPGFGQQFGRKFFLGDHGVPPPT